MNTGHPTRVRPVRVAKAVTLVDRRPDGTVYLRNPNPLGPYPVALTDRLVDWALKAPDRTLAAQRNARGEWQHLTYAGALERVRRVAQALLGRGLSAERPIVMLSGNSLDHLVLALAAKHVGIPYAPIAPAYSLQAREFDALRFVFDQMQPGLVLASDTTAFQRALAAVVPAGVEVIGAPSGGGAGHPATPFESLLDTAATADVERAHATVTGDTVAKILFTSGSTGRPKAVIMMMTGLGATESSPYALSTGFDGAVSGRIGLPVPGVEVKLSPVGAKIEARLRGPNITPGFFRQPDLTAAAFDEEGFYKLGDAVQWVDERDPGLGLVFDGRINEDFKLSTGTWVSVGPLRVKFLQHFGGLAQDVVLTAPDRAFVAALVFPAVEACAALAPNLPVGATEEQVVSHPTVQARISTLLDDFARHQTGSATTVARLILLTTRPSLDAREITDKGSLNQKAVLTSRASLVDDLYADPPPPHVIVCGARVRRGTP